MTGVTLPWVQALPLKMQSVLFSGLRGPDTHHAPAIKHIVRWLRPATQINADPTTDYMRKEKLPQWETVKKDLEFSTVHYFAHLMHAMQIIAAYHPDETVKRDALLFYQEMVELLHLNTESTTQMCARLGH